MSKGIGEKYLNISIHALREEGDGCQPESKTKSKYFYPRPPRGGRPSKRHDTKRRGENFYPRPPRGGRPDYIQQPEEDTYISIHALREEGDRKSAERYHDDARFLSTPSARRATTAAYSLTTCSKISIHALREEGDQAHHREHLQASISIHALREEGDPIHKQLFDVS